MSLIQIVQLKTTRRGVCRGRDCIYLELPIPWPFAGTTNLKTFRIFLFHCQKDLVFGLSTTPRDDERLID
jgi:hypothetical protein